MEAIEAMQGIAKQIADDGFAVCENLISSARVDAIIEALERASDTVHARKRGEQTYALRNILNAIPEVRELAHEPALFSMVQQILGADATPVKATLFDKTVEANWNLRWHQDNVIAVKERAEVDGFHGWTEKTGIPHVRPPVEILQQMLAARIHLDDTPEENGALMVIRGSHLHGRLSEEEYGNYIADTQNQIVCVAERGDVLFMRPLLLHCSKPALQPRHRRVLHIEYASGSLPHGLEWGE